MSLELYLRGKIWHYRGTVNSKRLRRSTGTSIKKDAQRIKAEAEAQAWRSHLDGPRAHITMAQAINSYLDAGRSDRFLSDINDYWKDTLLRDITGEDVRASAGEIYPDTSASTWNRQALTPTQAVINHAAQKSWCNPIKVTKFDHNAATRIPVTLEWVNAFATQATQDGLPHLAALCLFMFGTAARVGEAVRMTWDEVDLQKGKAGLYGFKPKPWSRVAHMPPRVKAALSNIPSNRNPDAKVFEYAESGSVTKVWNNVVKRADIDPLTPHCCRHGFATTMLHAGFDVVTIAKRGGWKDPATVLRIYGHALEDPTVTDVLFDTNLTQDATDEPLTTSNKKEISL